MNILMVRLRLIGDVVFTTPAIHAKGVNSVAGRDQAGNCVAQMRPIAVRKRVRRGLAEGYAGET